VPLHPLVKEKDKEKRLQGIQHQIRDKGDEGLIEVLEDILDRLEELEKKK